MILAATTTPTTNWATIGTIAVAVVGAFATVVAGFLAYRSTRTATAMTTQTTAQTATLESVDRRISEVFDATGAENARLATEIQRYQEREGVLLDRISRLEASFTSYRDQTDTRIREQGERISVLTGEVHELRSSDTSWRRWSGQVILMYATAVERLRRYGESDTPDLPPTPPLT